MDFQKRISKPNENNKYYINTIKGGYNKCIIIKNDYCLPNCVGYAYGRFMECQKITKCNLSRGNAEDWYDYNDGYKRGNKPKLGAIACWKSGETKKKSDGVGHLAIVEEIYDDNSILISESNYNGKIFNLRKVTNNYKLNQKIFQGFIYPNIEFNKKREWKTGKYKLLKNKYIRTTPEITEKNFVKVKDCTSKMKKALTSTKPMDNAIIKKGKIITALKIVEDNEKRVYCKNYSGYICLCNKNGEAQAEFTN